MADEKQGEPLSDDFALQHPDGAPTFPKVHLIEPTTHGYLLAAAVIDRRPALGFVVESGQKRRLLTRLAARARDLRAQPGVVDVSIFKALVIPPGRGEHLKKRPAARVARYDVVALLEAESPARAADVRAGQAWTALLGDLRDASEDVYAIAATNVKRIGPVDHGRAGVFLFNFFFADRTEQNLAVWEYTAGWFEDQTGLDNSTVLLPDAGESTDYAIVNHCRWDRLRDIVPSLLFKPSFRSYVLAHFQANDTAAIPILYRLA